MLDWLSEVELAEAQMLAAAASDTSSVEADGTSNVLPFDNTMTNPGGTDSTDGDVVSVGGSVAWLMLGMLSIALLLRSYGLTPVLTPVLTITRTR